MRQILERLPTAWAWVIVCGFIFLGGTRAGEAQDALSRVRVLEPVARAQVLSVGLPELEDDQLRDRWQRMGGATADFDTPAKLRQIKKLGLRKLSDRLVDEAYQPDAETLKDDIGSLRAHLHVLESLDASIREELGGGTRDEQRIVDAERYVACGWMHAWATLGRLSRKIAALPAGVDLDALRKGLLGLDPDNPSPLSLLLTTYRQMVQRTDRFKEHLGSVAAAAYRFDPCRRHPRTKELAAWEEYCTTHDDPIKTRLFDETGLESQLGPSWLRRSEAGERSFLTLSGAQIVGEPTDEVRENGWPHSLWAVVNLQLDTWHSWGRIKADDEVQQPELVDVSKLLTQLAESQDLKAFAAESHATAAGFQERVRRLGLFLEVRDALANPETLRGLVKAVRDYRNGHRPEQQNQELLLQSSSLFAKIFRAAGPVEDEYLADAAIWLRYAVLLSYRGDGGLVLVGSGANSIDQFWKRHDLPQQQFLLAESAPRKTPFVRWTDYPRPGDIAHVLGDVCAASYFYLDHLHDVRQIEEQRFNREDYAVRLQERLNRLGTELERCDLLHVGRAPPESSQTPEELRRRLERELAALPGQGWRRSFTRAEQERLAADLAELRDRIQSTVAYQDLIVAIAKAGSARGTAGALAVFSGLSELSNVELEVPPTASLDVYGRRITELARTLEERTRKERADRHLVRSYQTAQWTAQIKELELQATTFALTAAEHAFRMSEIYQRIADLDRQIADLQKLADEYRLKAAENDARAAAIRWSLAVRARDLAAAEVAALTEALEQAPKIVDETVSRLQGLAEQLRARADQLEDEKHRSFIVGLIKSAVRVVGLALAPFTGGASMGIAQAVERAVDLVDAASRMDWSDLGTVVNNLSTLAQQGVKVADLTVAAVGGAQLRQDWAHLKAQFQNLGQQVAGDVNRLLQGINGLNDLVTAANAAAAGLPVKFEQNKLVLTLKDLPTVQINDPELEKALGELLRGGIVFRTGIEQRFRGLSQLPLLKDEQLKSELARLLESAVQLAPEDVRRRYVELGGVVVKAEAARKQLSGLLDEDPRRRELLAGLLGAGMTITVTPDNAVVAIGLPVEKELKALKQDLTAFQEKVFDQAVMSLVRQIEDKQKQLQERVAQAEKAQDETALRQIADDIGGDPDNPNQAGIIHSIAGHPKRRDSKGEPDRGLLGRLAAELDEAKRKLDDSQLGVDASSLERAAKQFRERAATVRLEAADLKIQRALLVGDVADFQLERDRSLWEALKLRRRAEEEDAQLARLVARQAYYDCTDHGIDPHAWAWNADGPDAFAVSEIGLTVGSVLTRKKSPADVIGRSILAELYAEFAGLLRWQHFLGIPTAAAADARTATDWYLKLLREATTDDPASQQAQKIRQWSEIIARDIETKASEVLIVDSKQPIFRQERIHFFDANHRAGFDPWLSGDGQRFRLSVVGRLDVEIGNGRDLDPQALSETDDLFAVVSKITVVRSPNASVEVSNLRFIVVRPVLARTYEGRTAFPSSGSGTSLSIATAARDVANDGAAVIGKEFVEKEIAQWRTNPQFAGLYGTWSIYILDTRFGKPETASVDRLRWLEEYRNHLQLEVWLPYVRVKR